MNSRKDRFNVAKTFLAQYPIGKICTLGELLDFGISIGYCEPNTNLIVQKYKRDQLRRWLNNTGKCKEWRKAGYPAFSIEVVRTSVWYKVEAIEVVAPRKISELPTRIHDTTDSRKKSIHELLKCKDDMDEWPTYVLLLYNEIKDMQNDITKLTTNVTRKMEKIEGLYKDKKISPHEKELLSIIFDLQKA